MIIKQVCRLCMFLVLSTNVQGALKDNADGTISDLASGLMWQKSELSKTVDRPDAISYCNDLNLAGNNDWRLPYVKELSSIVDHRRVTPAIDLKMFPDPALTFYWSASNDANDNSQVWLVNFSSGEAFPTPQIINFYVRCVR